MYGQMLRKPTAHWFSAPPLNTLNQSISPPPAADCLRISSTMAFVPAKTSAAVCTRGKCRSSVLFVPMRTMKSLGERAKSNSPFCRFQRMFSVR